MKNSLTPREQEILSLVEKGAGIKEIASTLDISKKTVEKHKSNIKIKSNLFTSLTPREKEIVKLVSKGHTNKEIGNLLSLKEKSVKNFLVTIFWKTGCGNRVKLALYKMENCCG